MISRLRESLALLLIALLPLHAILVTVLTKLILGPGHAPLAALALWKEGVLATILLLACTEIVLGVREKKSVGHSSPWSIDALDLTILIGVLYAFLVQISPHSSLLTPHSSFLFGFKYDFLPLVAFMILRRVPWSLWFHQAVMRVLFAVGGIVAAYGILTFFLPLTFFTSLGYSDLHSLYQADGPLAAFQQIGGSSLRRIQSTMSGPNQLGIWLLIPLGLLISQQRPKKLLSYGLWLVILVALVLTFSRAAWVGATAMLLLAVLISRKDRAGILRSLSAIFIMMASAGIALTLLMPHVVLRMSSTSDHLKKPVEALKIILAHPFGLGLGSAGPASNRSSDTCVMQALGTDASWATDHPNLCVFVGGQQVQPTTRVCSCPLLTENWYLQWGVEMGVLGLVLSVMLVLLIFKSHKSKVNSHVLLTFLGISVCALFLHAWEDAVVVYTVWFLLAALRED